jgi:hypothetical protein
MTTTTPPDPATVPGFSLPAFALSYGLPPATHPNTDHPAPTDRSTTCRPTTQPPTTGRAFTHPLPRFQPVSKAAWYQVSHSKEV